MATYAIGDIQGCHDELRRLLDRLAFDPERDHLWLAGDLVNRGPQSLEVLRYVKGLGERAVCVLGNHDLHLLAVSQGDQGRDPDPSLDPILRAPDRDELLQWLRRRPLLYRDRAKGYTLIHAALAPQWDLATAARCAREVEQALRGDLFPHLMRAMYGNKPARWSPDLTGMDRLRFIINCLTRARYFTLEGDIGLKDKGPPGTQGPGFLPWFEVPGRTSAGERILCGHWSTLGFVNRHNVWSLDTGCLWGGSLTAVRVRQKGPLEPVRIPCTEKQAPHRAPIGLPSDVDGSGRGVKTGG